MDYPAIMENPTIDERYRALRENADADPAAEMAIRVNGLYGFTASDFLL